MQEYATKYCYEREAYIVSLTNGLPPVSEIIGDGVGTYLGLFQHFVNAVKVTESAVPIHS